jgi:predicted HTH domain antitoxin
MQTVNLTSLKANPTKALRKSHEELVVVLNRGQPEALMVGLASTGMLELAGVRSALATALLRDGRLSLARAARVAQMPLPKFSAHLSRLGIPVVQMSAAESERDLETLDRWLAGS